MSNKSLFETPKKSSIEGTIGSVVGSSPPGDDELDDNTIFSSGWDGDVGYNSTQATFNSFDYIEREEYLETHVNSDDTPLLRQEALSNSTFRFNKITVPRTPVKVRPAWVQSALYIQGMQARSGGSPTADTPAPSSPRALWEGASGYNEMPDTHWRSPETDDRSLAPTSPQTWSEEEEEYLRYASEPPESLPYPPPRSPSLDYMPKTELAVTDFGDPVSLRGAMQAPRSSLLPDSGDPLVSLRGHESPNGNECENEESFDESYASINELVNNLTRNLADMDKSSRSAGIDMLVAQYPVTVPRAVVSVLMHHTSIAIHSA